MIKTIKEQEILMMISKTDQQKNLTQTADQASLLDTPSYHLNPYADIASIFGIFTHGSGHHGPIALLKVTGKALKSEHKVA